MAGVLVDSLRLGEVAALRIGRLGLRLVWQRQRHVLRSRSSQRVGHVLPHGLGPLVSLRPREQVDRDEREREAVHRGKDLSLVENWF
jgi:hypothetical protein